ncbi:MAG: hypothetical protein CMJ06_02245 [Pelagibacterales bacterium]|nr:hypothetical protein [Pelagibacterales bacterium]OUU63236.1 MAG: hypothetical protein CBC22_02210 [Alphaproteobacteria bacterium TMED62]|tara:strand:+ start:9042 stop:10574 length:1533 start_codon:yes stop_codon:yes gene_type:complete
MPTFKIAYLPPLLIYASAGVSGLTSIVGVFFIKDYLSLSAAFIASIGFWAGIPWALKMPIGFLIDRYWYFKQYFVYLGAFLVSISLIIMYGILVHKGLMLKYFDIKVWFIISSILTPIGYVLQDVVADAMTVEAVEPNFKSKLNNIKTKLIKKEHTIVQLYGRFAIIFGSLLVGLINFFIFKGIDKNYPDINLLYGKIYIYALIIPSISVSGIILFNFLNKKATKAIKFKTSKLDYQIFIGSCIFVIFTIILGSLKIPFSREIVLGCSLLLISILMRLLIKNLRKEDQHTIVGTAIIIFVFRAMPGPGAGLNWFEIDILGFNQSFFSILSITSALITLIGMLVFKNIMINAPLAKLFLILSILSSILYSPSLFMYYGFHEYTSVITNGLIDAKFIALLNTAVESPLSQVAMIPLLAWIAKNAPSKYKATFFAVFASFTNIALSARELFTSYLNNIFIIKREILDTQSSKIIEEANYNDLDNLLISLILLTLIIPVITIYLVQRSKFKSIE